MLDYRRLLIACVVVLDFIDSCPGGDSWLEAPDGTVLHTDWGYVGDGVRELKRWALKNVANELSKFPVAWPPEGSTSVRVYPKEEKE